MNALEMLTSRVSVDEVIEPAPPREELQEILQTAMSAPDHGKMRPWRFVLIEGEFRKKFADMMGKAMASQKHPVPEEKIEKRQKKFSTTPLIIAVGMHLEKDAKIPLVEQQMAAAAATMNVMNAFYARGYGALWISGDMTYNKKIRKKLGFAAPHQLAGYILVGTPAQPLPTDRKRPSVSKYIQSWTGDTPVFEADA